MNMRRSNREAGSAEGGSAAPRAMLIVWLRRKFKIEQYGLRRQVSLSCRVPRRREDISYSFLIERNVTGMVRDLTRALPRRSPVSQTGNAVYPAASPQAVFST